MGIAYRRKTVNIVVNINIIVNVANEVNEESGWFVTNGLRLGLIEFVLLTEQELIVDMCYLCR